MSREDGRRVPVRAAGVLATVLGTTALVTGLLLPDLLAARDALGTGAWRHLGFDRVLVWGAEAVAVGCLAWLSTVSVLALAPVLRPGAATVVAPVRRRGCPAWVHRALVAACGVGLTAALASPAHADLPPRVATGGTAGDPRVVAGLPYPDRAPGGREPSTHRPARPGAAPPAARTHTVRPGDTLWDIAAAGLGPGADDAAVAARWRLIHRHNAGVLGADPDLIHPGTVLRIPHERPERPE